MEPQHHNKIVWIAGIFILIIVLIFGFVIFFGKNFKTQPVPVVNENQAYIDLVEVTTASAESSISDPEVQKLNQSTSGTAGGSSGNNANRDALIQMTSSN